MTDERAPEQNATDRELADRVITAEKEAEQLKRQAEQLRDALRDPDVTDEQRLEVFGIIADEVCGWCGDRCGRSCQCMNDE